MYTEILKSKKKRALSVFSLTMINVIAVDSLRTLPISAKLGSELVGYYLLAALVFFIPVTLIASELATTYPSTGGIYIWVREAYGKRAGFMTIWLQWIYNVVWYPTILAFIVDTIAYVFAPELANNQHYVMYTSIVLFWCFTFMNFFGMNLSSIISTIGALFGTLMPMIGIIILAVIWLMLKEPVITQNYNLIPNLMIPGNWPIFSAVLFGLMGIEMSAVHAEDVQNPGKNYPRALAYSSTLIFLTLLFGSLSITLVIPTNELSIISGFMDGYKIFFNTYKLPILTPVMAMCIVVGGFSGISAWIIGPAKGLLVAARDGILPPMFAKTNKYGVPVNILLVQGLIFTTLMVVFNLFDSMNTAYWLLSDLSAQLSLLVYLFMFLAFIKLRKTQSHRHRPYKIPGGKIGILCTAGIGSLACVTSIFIGFIPPTDIAIGNIVFFELFLIIGLVFFIGLPYMLNRANTI